MPSIRARYNMRHTFPTLCRRLGAANALTVLLFGCVSVDPKPDYQRASDIIAERTGVEEVYDPQAEELVETKVEDLLAGGLTADEAVRIALLNNRAFQSAFREIGVSRAQVVESGLMSNPSLGLSLRFPEGGGRSNLSMSFAQQLVDIWQIPVREKIAEAELEHTLLMVAHLGVELTSEVQSRYYRLLALERAEMLADEDMDLALKSVSLAENRFQAGESDKLEVDLARTGEFEVRRRLISLRQEVRQARSDLARVLGLVRRDDGWTLAEDFPTHPMPIPDETTLLATAMSQRLDARAAAMQVQSADAEVRKQILDIFPNVTLGLEGERPERRALPGRKILADTARASMRSGQPTAPDIQTRSERDLERRQIIDLLLGPTLDITLPIWHQNQPQIAKARYQAMQRRCEFEDLLDAVAQDVQKAVAALESSSELVGFYQDAGLPLARETVEAAQRAFEAGEQSILVLMEAQKSLVAQRADYVNAQRDYAIALADLQRAIGGVVPEGMLTGPGIDSSPASEVAP